MTEEFLHFIWKTGMVRSPLRLTDGRKLEVIKRGEHNQDSGPDFQNARVVIDGISWAGNVEIHTKSSEWYRHGHQHDRAYDNVILHVVGISDRPVRRGDGSLVPELEVNGFIQGNVQKMYDYLLRSRRWIACEELVDTVDPIIIKSWMDALAGERLNRKNIEYLKLLEGKQGDFMLLFYLLLFRSFGHRVNVVPFEWLQKSFDYRIIDKIRGDTGKMEALLFGQSGLLDQQATDTYTRILIAEYQHLKNKFGLKRIDKVTWKFARMQPSGFPTLRIAQLAALLNEVPDLYHVISRGYSYDELYNIMAVEPSEYWSTHYVFGKPSPEKSKKIGRDRAELLMINFIVPVLILRSDLEGQARYREMAIRLLEELPAENNTVVSGFMNRQFPVSSALDSQALLEMKNMYCRFKRCLDCRIGYQILKK